MTFIQCKDEEEVAKVMYDQRAGFVTSDHRIYDEIAMCCSTEERSDRVYLRKEEIKTVYLPKLGRF